MDTDPAKLINDFTQGYEAMRRYTSVMVTGKRFILFRIAGHSCRVWPKRYCPVMYVITGRGQRWVSRSPRLEWVGRTSYTMLLFTIVDLEIRGKL